MDEQMVLNSPFSIERHKKTFIDYLEVIIDENGVVMYAVPSHQEKLIAIACGKLGITRDELNDRCPGEYYGNFIQWLSQITGCIPVWNKFTVGDLNILQKETLLKLAEENLYYGAIK